MNSTENFCNQTSKKLEISIFHEKYPQSNRSLVVSYESVDPNGTCLDGREDLYAYDVMEADDNFRNGKVI